MNCNPELAALLSQPWSNNACRGYVIYAMEHCGFAPGDIRRVVAELHEVFDFCGLEEAQQHFENSPYSLRDNLSHSGARRKGGTLAVPLFCVSPLDNGEAKCVVFIP